MITNEDIKKLIVAFTPIFATKQDLQELKQELREELASKEELRTVTTTLDKVMGEVKAVRQEQTFHRGEHDRIETRLTKLERSSPSRG